MTRDTIRKVLARVAREMGGEQFELKITREAAPAALERIKSVMPWTRKTPPMEEPGGLGLEELQAPRDPNPTGSDIFEDPDSTQMTQLSELENHLREWMAINYIDEGFADSFLARVTTELANEMGNAPDPWEQLRAQPDLKEKGMPSQYIPEAGGTTARHPGRGAKVEMINELLSLADAADGAGMEKEADRITALLPTISLLKTAQYEGVQHYFLLNGRSFEKAWREKRKKKQSDDSRYHLDEPGWYRSAHECWWEVLDEYQDKLLGNHSDWLAKHASKDKKKDKGEVEDGMMGGPSQPMSRAMYKKHKEMEGRGETPGEGIVRWLTEQSKKAADMALLEKIAERVDSGSSPGVAIHEAVEHCASGGFAEDVISQASEVVSGIRDQAKKDGNEELEKAAQQWLGKGLNWLQDVGKGIGKGVGKAWEGVKGLPGKAMEAPGKAWEGVKEFGRGEMEAATLYKQVEPHITNLKYLLDAVSQDPAGSAKWTGGLQRRVDSLIQEINNITQQPQEMQPGAGQPAAPAAPTAPAAGVPQKATAPAVAPVA